jgi:hypothetical protein
MEKIIFCDGFFTLTSFDSFVLCDFVRFLFNPMFPRAELLYTRCYCEENIYQLCQWVKETKPNVLDALTVVFISNPLRRVSDKQYGRLHMRADTIVRDQYGNSPALWKGMF